MDVYRESWCSWKLQSLCQKSHFIYTNNRFVIQHVYVFIHSLKIDFFYIGWSWKFAEFVFLERSFDKDREIITKQLNEIFDYPDPVW